MKISGEKQRTFAQIREHYEVENRLANQLRNANKSDRMKLYSHLYNELYRLVPHHPQLIKKNNEEVSSEHVELQMKLLLRFLDKEKTFLEIGSGDCALSLEVSNFAKKVYAIDVSEEIAKGVRPQKNFEFLLSDGCSIPVAKNSIDVAYSYQLIEHLHPDDAYEQIKNIYRTISHNGIYICVTTNRITGPHDISKYFDEIATGFHIKEYTSCELHNIFQQCGFSKIEFYIAIKSIYFRVPFPIIRIYEKIIENFNYPLIKRICRIKPIRILLETIIIVGIKK